MQSLGKYRVLSLGQALAAPYGDMMLADMGADVVKVEPPGVGDHVRKWSRGDLKGQSPHFLSVNRNKRSIVVDLKAESGVALLKDLAVEADVVVENFRPGTMDRLDLGEAVLRALNPRLIVCSVSGFGQTGPYVGRPAYDMVIQDESGFISVTGTEDGQFAKFGAPGIDVMAAMVSACSIECALIEREHTGKGRYLDIPMLEVATSVMGFNLISYSLCGEIPRPMGTAHPLLAPYQVYSTRSSPMCVALLTETHWAEFCDLVGRPELTSDPKFATAVNRIDHRVELNKEIEPVLRTRPAEEWLAEFQRRGLVGGAVNDVAALLCHPQLVARNFFIHWPLPGGATAVVPGMPCRMEGRGAPATRQSPQLGEHSDKVLREWLGLDADAIESLKHAGVVE